MQSTISKQQWLNWIDEQEQSDLSIAAFCRTQQINVDNFYYHRAQQRKKTARKETGFVRAQLPAPPITSTAVITITYSEVTIRLPLEAHACAAQLIKSLR